MTKQKRLFLVDGAALAYRMYFAFVNRPLTNSKGLNTSAVFGFTQTLLSILEKENPEYFAVVFDSDQPTFRHKAFQAYKATRQKMPKDMAESLPYVEKVTRALGIPFWMKPGYEADDLIGTFARRAEKEGFEVFILSGDKDFMQILSPKVKMLSPKRLEEIETVGVEQVREKFGVSPEKVVDVLALTGDTSDNVPGVPGIGPKTAAQLIQRFGSMEKVLDAVDEIEKPKLKEALKKHAQDARLSKKLVTIDVQVPIEWSLGALKAKPPDKDKVRSLFQELEFHSLWKRFERFSEEIRRPAAEQGLEERSVASGGRPQGNYRVLSSLSQLEECLQKAEAAECVAVDTETDGLNPRRDAIVGVSFAWAPGEACYVPFNGNLDAGEIWRRMKPFLEAQNPPKGGQNLKFDRQVFAAQGVELASSAFDTLLEAYLLDPNARHHDLDTLALRHLGLSKIPTQELLGKGKKALRMSEVTLEKVGAYACEDADVTLRLHEKLFPEIQKKKMEKLYTDVELPLSEVLARMEQKGVALDVPYLESLSKEVEKDLRRLEKEIYKETGCSFNLNSPKQLGEVLFEKMQLHKVAGVRVKKRTTGFATDNDTLEAYRGVPVVEKVMEYRQLAKLQNTYLQVLPKLVDPSDGRVHTSFNQAVTATGRLSSSDPNLQNIPVRTEIGRKIRQAFIAPRGHVLISADYSQIELRILAHFAEDEAMLEAFRKGVDVHAQTASRIFKVPLEKVDRRLRDRAKTINFGVLYGMGPQRLARENKVSLSEAKAFIENYFREFPQIKRFLDQQVEKARQTRQVETLLGRIRPLPDIVSSNIGLRINAEHMAVNTPIQGSAADLIKVAMVRIGRMLRKKKWKTEMVLQVHDELVLEAPKEEAEEVAENVRREMESALSLRVPLKVDIGMGRHWLEAH